MARNSKTSAADREALNTLFGDFVEAPAKPAHLEAEARSATVSEAIDKLAPKDRVTGLSLTEFQATDRSTPPEDKGFMKPLAKTYLANAIAGLTRSPSPKLKDDFRATLSHWRALAIMALRDAPDEPTAFINVVVATVESEGAFDAIRLIRNVAGQLLWQASIDVQRDRRLASELDTRRDEEITLDAHGEVVNDNLVDGELDHVDASFVAPPIEDEAVDALIEAHGWLSTVADLLPNDEDDRLRLGLEDGLEFTQVKQELDWVRVYDVNDAIQIQLDKNRESMKRRDGKKVLERKDAFVALARLAA